MRKPKTDLLEENRSDSAVSLHRISRAQSFSVDTTPEFEVKEQRPTTRESVIRSSEFVGFLALLAYSLYDQSEATPGAQAVAENYFTSPAHAQDIANLIPQFMMIMAFLGEKSCCRPKAVEGTIQEALLIEAPKNKKVEAIRAVVPYVETTVATAAMMMVIRYLLLSFEEPKDLSEFEAIESIAPAIIHLVASALQKDKGYSVNKFQYLLHALLAGTAVGIATGFESDDASQLPSLMDDMDMAPRIVVATLSAMLAAVVATALIAPPEKVKAMASQCGDSISKAMKSCCSWMRCKKSEDAEFTPEQNISVTL